MRFDTLLVANRGEIALRVIRAARAQGLRTVAVYSDADAESRHVREADMAVHIGAAPAHASYRNVEALLRACALSGAQAVHPGYGFLSENAAFARAVTQAGLTFVGPSAEVIDLMGNKARAKEALRHADVPTVPGAQGLSDDRELAARARAIGYPVLLKAAAGGGGRGMRLARDEAELAQALPLARSEALGAFGSDELILEKAILGARHVEIQVLCDEHGNALHLGERDCSLQRRYQKLVEESPSPAVSPALRERMGAVAVRACQAIGYVGAGTLEFLVDAAGDFHFMEMNTRLQVEHGVTELVTGIDLVQWQLRVAQGEPLGLRQEDVRSRGHAMELRVCAEDPAAGFVPQVGTVLRWVEPPGLRVDTALEDGLEITPHYDSMLAKYLAWGETREECIRKLMRACEAGGLLGVRSNLHFLARAIDHPEFRDGGVTTGFLAGQDMTSGHWRAQPSEHALAAAALALAGWPAAHARPCLAAQGEVALDDASDGASRLLRISQQADGGLSVDAWEGHVAEGECRRVRIEAAHRRGDDLALVVGGLRRSLRVAMEGANAAWVQDGASVWRFLRATRFAGRDDGQAGQARTLRAPMSGRVIGVEVRDGDSVTAQQTVLVLESMKMEMSIAAGAAGIVARVAVAAGDQVSTGQVLMEVQQ
ncbi:methylcrotonoyl-CoA carboxylase [Achromobacter pulmonis]|uniref:Methylcrotonoyl-CoA carboxylase n=1 Tax=Achromobacter pulmonis TaxID=1389932 RepID=A0A2N8KJC5_9BURK|nr:biotin carboxylase N-terminal domain-containing protein [Achromobacter pulmonis]PND33555.1 methylcrotonoyl-CoA carboxylase [Achromobacter pulmonis]